MHPGPVNRGVALSPDLIDGPTGLITAQVEGGPVVRMAVLYELLAGGPRPRGAREDTEAELPAPTPIIKEPA
jgi:aspartate carbamoyltransferase catalytic subunit